MKKTMHASEIAYEMFIRGDAVTEAELEEERQKLRLIAQVRELREKAGLTQRELAKKVGTTAAAIARLEDPDDASHSIENLQRTVSALGMELKMSIVKKAGQKRPRKRAVPA